MNAHYRLAVAALLAAGACACSGAPPPPPPPVALDQPGAPAASAVDPDAAASAAPAPTVPKGQSRGMTPDLSPEDSSLKPRKPGPRPSSAGGTRGEQEPSRDSP
jgi:hypothetical protein